VSATSRCTRGSIDRGPLVGSPRHALRRSVMMHPSLYLPLARWKRAESGRVLDARTELVLDGLERSANTFAAIAFQVAQNDHVRVAHHMHAVAPLIEAAARGVPTLITARAPRATIASAMIRQPRVTAGQWLKTYAAFYERLMDSRDGFVIATFEEVTSDFGAVIRRVNQRFSTDFREFDHTEANVKTVFTLADERAEGPPWQPLLNRFLSGFMSVDEYLSATRAYRESPTKGTRASVEDHVGRPSAAREAAKPVILQRYHASSLGGPRTRAERAYRLFVERPGVMS
jgi:hypothetical protein